jgi:GT2 family glycosyltransferase
VASAVGARPTIAPIVVSANSARWLRPCLQTLYEHAGDVELDVVVVAAGCSDETVDLVHSEFPDARTVECENRGFGFANNRALETVTSDWVLFLNPDTELRAGTLADLVAEVSARPSVAVAAVRQLTPDGQLFPTIRRFPNAARSLFEALGSERYPFRASWLGERELDLSVYEHETTCDWTTGAFMLVRRAALDQVGSFDERFFLYCEETDLCLRLKRAGWDVVHVPAMTILHHADKAGWNPQLEAQAAYAKRQYIAKHFSPAHRAAATAALALGYGLRSVVGGARSAPRKASARASFATLVGRAPPPFAAQLERGRR